MLPVCQLPRVGRDGGKAHSMTGSVPSHTTCRPRVAAEAATDDFTGGVGADASIRDRVSALLPLDQICRSRRIVSRSSRKGQSLCYVVEDVLTHEEHRDACNESETDDGCDMLAVEAMGAAWVDGCLSLLAAVVGCRSFSPHTPSARRLPALLSRASCLPVAVLTTRHDSACQWSALCSAAAFRRCLCDALPNPGVGLI